MWFTFHIPRAKDKYVGKQELRNPQYDYPSKYYGKIESI